MKTLLFALATFLGIAAFVSDANAYVCGYGWRGAGCVSRYGAVGVYRRPYGYGYAYGYRHPYRYGYAYGYRW